MNYLFVHQNFPGQYRHLVRHLAAQPGNRVVFLTQHPNVAIPGVHSVVYQRQREVTAGVHHYVRDTEAGVLNAQAVARKALALKRAGFVPDLMLGHNGWGEIAFLKDVFPQVPLIGYFEYFYRSHGGDVGFDPAEAVAFDTFPRIRAKNLGNLLGLDACDWGQCPTEWQKSRYPERYQSMLHVIHDGIDTQVVRPDPRASLTLPAKSDASDTVTLRAGDEVVTYVARNLEPYRGFPQFMRSLPAILQARPSARIVIVGGDEVSYGGRLPPGETYRQRLLHELGDVLDSSRVHFLGKVPYATFRTLLQVSMVHVYLTYPFVLSWSMLEAMAAGCRLIASRTAPVEEVVRDGENGLLVDFFDPAVLAGRVIDVLKEPRDFDELRQRARQTVVDRYDLQTVCLPAQLRWLEEVRAMATP